MGVGGCGEGVRLTLNRWRWWSSDTGERLCLLATATVVAMMEMESDVSARSAPSSRMVGWLKRVWLEPTNERIILVSNSFEFELSIEFRKSPAVMHTPKPRIK